MAKNIFNKINIAGNTFGIEEFVNGEGIVSFIPTDKSVTTLDHKINRVRSHIFVEAKCVLWGDKTSLQTQATTTDQDNFGSRVILYYNNTVLFDLFGLISCRFDPDKRQTDIKVKGVLYAN